jgi:hypothetical protein
VIDFGVEKETINLDDSGSTVTTERKIMNSTIVKPVRRYYEYRVKVKDKKEELTEYLKFSDSLDKNKLDPGFRIEHTKHGDDTGYYFVVKCYTTLDYGKGQ